MREIATAPDLSAASLLCAALREQGIAAETAQTATAALLASGTPVPILVPDDQEEHAREVLAGLEDRPAPDVNDPPRLPDWRCAACRHTVPATLGLCWSCQAPRPEDPARAATRHGYDETEEDEEEEEEEEEEDDDGEVAPGRPPPFSLRADPGPPGAEEGVTVADARSMALELGAVLLLFGVGRILHPVLEGFGLMPAYPEWEGLGRTLDDILSLLQALAVVWLVRRWRGEPASKFGLVRPRWGDLPAGVLVFLLYVLADLLVRWWTRVGWDVPPGPPRLGADVFAGLVTVVGLVAGAAHEEVLYRGYALARLRTLTGSNVLAVAASAALFGLLHFHYDAFDIFQVMVMGVVFALGYLACGRVGPVVVGHTLVNVYVTGWM